MDAEPTVFVVNDDQDVVDSVCALARSMGVSAEPFASAEAFLAAIDGALSGCPVTDLRLLGMSGLALLERLDQAPNETVSDRLERLTPSELQGWSY